MTADGEPDERSLGPAERVELVSTDPAFRGPGEERAVLSAITFFKPCAYATDWCDTAAMPNETRRIELCYGVELDFPLSGTTYRTAMVSVDLPEDCHIVEVLGDPSAEQSVGGSRFRQHLDWPEVGRTIRMRLIVEIPADRTHLIGSMMCGVKLRRSVLVRWHEIPAVAAKEASFTTNIPAQHVGPVVPLSRMADIPRARRVFAAHGRNRALRRELFTFLRAVDLAPFEWSEVLALADRPSALIGDLLDRVLAEVQAVLVLLTPDDEVRLKPEFADGPDDAELRVQGQARLNVLFEAGMAERFPSQVIYAVVGSVRTFTDLGGRFVTRLNDSPESRSRLVEQLEMAGCAVRAKHRSDWYRSGTFTSPKRGEDIEFIIDRPVIRATSGGWVIDGHITSNGDHMVTAVLEATMYDADHVFLGNAHGLAQELRPGKRTAFRLIAEGDLTLDTQVQVTAEVNFP
jgi:hypothetical protein